MTGRDLILYILANGLEDELVFENGRFLGFLTPEEVAVKKNTGVATVDTMLKLGMIEYIELAGGRYIPANII